MAEALAVATILMIAVMASVLVGYRIGLHERRAVNSAWHLTASTLDLGPHIHRFDTMIADGKGWRCGICGAIKPDQNLPRRP